MNTLQHEVQTRHQMSHTRVALSSHKEHVRTAQEFAADLLQYTSMFSTYSYSYIYVHIHIHHTGGPAAADSQLGAAFCPSCCTYTCLDPQPYIICSADPLHHCSGLSSQEHISLDSHEPVLGFISANHTMRKSTAAFSLLFLIFNRGN